MTCTLIPDEQHPSLAKLIGLALPDGECVILEISTVDLRNPQQTIAHQSNACRIPQSCKQIRFTRIAAVSDRGETTLFDYADYQVAGSLETLSGTVKQREDAEKAIQTDHQQGKSIRKIPRDLGIPWRKANKLLNTWKLLHFYYRLPSIEQRQHSESKYGYRTFFLSFGFRQTRMITGFDFGIIG